jgi:hypothetical protein
VDRRADRFVFDRLPQGATAMRKVLLILLLAAFPTLADDMVTQA